MEPILPQQHSVHLEGPQMHCRTFLLGNEGGMVLHLPVEQNVRAHTIVPSKWFGVSEFGRKYLEVVRIWVDRAGERTLLSRENQIAFDQHLVEAVRTYLVDGVTVRQRYFVPNRLAGVVMTLESDRPSRFIVESQFDMRYYQTFNTDCSGYAAEVIDDNGPVLKVENCIAGPHEGQLTFYAMVRAVEAPASIELLPESERLVKRIYLKDEHRQKVIHAAYQETHETSPDEAPIWDSYSNAVYVPARLAVDGPATIVYTFDEHETRARDLSIHITGAVQELFKQAEESASEFLDSALVRTGDSEVDLAYTQIMTRFNSSLVARDVNVSTDGGGSVEHYSAIFAGDKYFLDAWKRDENISLEALFLANDFETARAILSDTWQHQDNRTGRLPQIIRLGQPIVYFSSDGTPWAVRRLWEYTRISGDHSLMDEKYEMVEHFFKASLPFVRNGLLPSGGIITRGFLWETWEDTAFTPRDGYPVEIELLWLTVLGDLLPIFKKRNGHLADQLERVREDGMKAFERFYLDGYLADSLDYDFRPRDLLTPNGYVAFGLDFPLPQDLRQAMVMTARHHLAGRIGVKSLAARDWPKVFSDEFLNDSSKINHANMTSVGIYNYHRGIEWLWFNQFMVAGELQHGDVDHAYRLYVYGQVRSVLQESGIGGLDELNDMHAPLGADFQAWSMASFSAGLHRFAGVTVDSISKRVLIQPQLPSPWPQLHTRHRVENCRFDVEVRRTEGDGLLVAVQTLDEMPKGYAIAIPGPVREADRITYDGRDITLNNVELEGDEHGRNWVGVSIP